MFAACLSKDARALCINSLKLIKLLSFLGDLIFLQLATNLLFVLLQPPTDIICVTILSNIAHACLSFSWICLSTFMALIISFLCFSTSLLQLNEAPHLSILLNTFTLLSIFFICIQCCLVYKRVWLAVLYTWSMFLLKRSTFFFFTGFWSTRFIFLYLLPGSSLPVSIVSLAIFKLVFLFPTENEGGRVRPLGMSSPCLLNYCLSLNVHPCL